MPDDLYGQPAALPDAALESWNATMQAFLAHGATTADHLARCLDRAPDFALGHAVKGLFLVLLGRRELLAPAADALAAARAADASDARSRAHVAALAACLARRPDAATDHLSRWIGAAPGDALAVKLDHALRFTLGDAAGMRAVLERAGGAYGPDHPAFGYILGCRAFALEETGAYGEAVATGHRALEHASDDAWGLHAVAHVHDMTADAGGGLAWLAGREAAWSHCNNFRFHVWWHKALLLLDLGRHDAALALYDAEIRAERTDDYRDIANATSLLTRLGLDGIDVGDRWEELAALSEARSADGCLVFADLHYLLALIGGGRAGAASRLVARIAADAAGGDAVSARMADPGRAASAGLAAFGEGRYAAAFAHLQAARPTLRRAGGSHAQRDVFERLTIDAGIRAGAWSRTEALIAERSRRRAGREDRFAATRRDLIAEARRARSAGMSLAYEAPHAPRRATAAARRIRDPKLDFFRGIAMFIIFVAHVPANPVNDWIPARFGFSDATEIFVFCSGMASAIAFGGAFDRAGWWLGTLRVLHRIWQVYWAHIGLFVACAAFLAGLDAFGSFDEAYIGTLNLWRFFDAASEPLLPGLVTLTYVPNYFDILPMYLVILAMIPAAMALSRLHPAAVALLVVPLWLAAQSGLALPAEPWSDRTWFFNPFAWQLAFFTGFALMRGWLPRPPARLAPVLAALAVVLAGLVCSDVAVREFGQDWLRGWRAENQVLLSKSNFGILRYVHFAALAYLAWLVAAPGERLSRDGGTSGAGSILTAIVIRVGQQSLAVFLASMFWARVTGFGLDQIGRGAAQIVLAHAVGFAIIVTVAYGVGWIKSAPWQRAA